MEPGFLCPARYAAATLSSSPCAALAATNQVGHCRTGFESEEPKPSFGGLCRCRLASFRAHRAPRFHPPIYAGYPLCQTCHPVLCLSDAPIQPCVEPPLAQVVQVRQQILLRLPGEAHDSTAAWARMARHLGRTTEFIQGRHVLRRSRMACHPLHGIFRGLLF